MKSKTLSNQKERRKMSKSDELIAKIAKRVAPIVGCDAITIMMDLTYCIQGGCNLRLEDMLNAREADLMHDIYGINQHLNHSTFELEGGFLPRFAGN